MSTIKYHKAKIDIVVYQKILTIFRSILIVDKSRAHEVFLRSSRFHSALDYNSEAQSDGKA